VEASSVIALVAAPTNLGLRPPQPSSVPGCAKAPEALREAGLHSRLVEAGAVDAGVVLSGRYVDDGDPAAGRVRNQDALVDHSWRLATRLEHLLAAGHSPLVLGGDCSLLVGTGLALRRRGGYGLVHIDGHTDFRHPGNSAVCLSLAGEDLAAAVGQHWPAVANLDGLSPYFSAPDVVHIGCRDNDEHLAETRQFTRRRHPGPAGSRGRGRGHRADCSRRRGPGSPGGVLAPPRRGRARP